MTAPLRMALAALLTDLGLYLLMLSLPYRVLEHGGSSAVLGSVPLLYAGPYAVVALVAGRFSDRWPRRAPIRFGLGLAAIAAVALHLVRPLGAALALVPLVGVGLGFFWPSLQAGFSELREGRDLDRLTRLFNISWSVGKGTGLLAGGLLLARIGTEGLALLSAVAWVGAALSVPWLRRPGDHAAALQEDPRRPPDTRQSAFLRSAWLANGIAFGVAATLNHHLPPLLNGRGIGADRFGIFLGGVFFSQTVVFLFLAPRPGWRYRAAPLLGIQALVLSAILIAPFAPSWPLLLALAPLFGLGLGFAYQSSLYYSLHARTGRGRQAGVHEAALGIASATIPVLGGVLATLSGRPVLPFVMAAGAVALSLIYATAELGFRRPAR